MPQDDNRGAGDRKPEMSETHRLLARMLARQRTAEQHARIDEILSSGVPAAEQVRLIRELDEAGAEPAARPTMAAAAVEPRTRHSARDVRPREISSLLGGVDLVPVSEERRRHHLERRSSLAQPVRRVGLWRYMRSHRRRVLRFNRFARMIHTGPLGVRPRLHRQALAPMRAFSEGPVRALYELLETVLLDGWRELPKYDYNLLVVLHSLTQTIMQVGFPEAVRSDRFPIRRYARAQRDVLVLLREDPEGARCVAALERHHRWTPETARPDMLKHATTIRSLLLATEAPTSLAGFLTATLIVSYGRFAALEDVLGSVEGELIDREQFDCDVSVRRRIEEHISMQVGRIQPLVDELARATPERSGSRVSSAVAIDPAYLRRFAGISADEGNVVVQASRIAEAVTQEWGPLLDGEVILAGGHRTRVFDRSCFTTEMGRIARVGEALERVRVGLPSFPRRRFDQLQLAAGDASALEREAVRQIEELAAQVVLVARKCARLEKSRCLSPGCAESESMPFGPGTFTRRFYAPDLDTFMAGPIPLAGQTVWAALTTVTPLAMYVGRFFREKSLRTEEEREHRIREELGTILANLRRVAHRTVYDRIIDRWPILVTEKVT